MNEYLTDEQKQRLMDRIATVLADDILMPEDESEILDICIRACKRKYAEMTEDILADTIRNEARHPSGSEE